MCRNPNSHKRNCPTYLPEVNAEMVCVEIRPHQQKIAINTIVVHVLIPLPPCFCLLHVVVTHALTRLGHGTPFALICKSSVNPSSLALGRNTPANLFRDTEDVPGNPFWKMKHCVRPRNVVSGKS